MGKIRPYKPRNRKYEMKSPFDRFMEKFKVNQKTGCWIWTGTHSGAGYATLFLYKIKGTNKSIRVYAHRLSYTIFVGDIPPDKEIDHLCRVRNCVNPTHLQLVSHRENMLLGETIAAINASRTHCPKGHPYDAKNTHISKRGDRMCKTCSRNRYLPQ
jgi:hypothetical protein